MITIILLLTLCVFEYLFSIDLEMKKIKIEDPEITLKLKSFENIDNITPSDVSFRIHNVNFTLRPVFGSENCSIENFYFLSDYQVAEEDINLAKSFLNKYEIVTLENAKEMIGGVSSYKNVDREKITFYKLDTDFCPLHYQFTYKYDRKNGYMSLMHFKSVPAFELGEETKNYLNCK